LSEKSLTVELDFTQNVILCVPTNNSYRTRILRLFTTTEWEEIQQKKREKKSGPIIGLMNFFRTPTKVFFDLEITEGGSQFEAFIIMIGVILVEEMLQ